MFEFQFPSSSLFIYFILSPVPSSFFLAQNQHICDFNCHDPHFTKPNISLPRNEPSWVVSILLWLRTFLNPRPFGPDKRWAGCYPRNRVSTSCSLVSVLHTEMTQHSGRTPIRERWDKMRVHAEDEINGNRRIAFAQRRKQLTGKTKSTLAWFFLVLN